MIREYATKDTDALVAIWRAASALAHPFLHEDFIEKEAGNLRTMHLPHAQTWVVEQDGAPIGFIAMIDNEIGGLFLSPSFHNKGFGRAMVDHAASLKGPLKVEVFEKNTIGRHFYDSYGFVETARYTYEPSGEIMLKLSMHPS